MSADVEDMKLLQLLVREAEALVHRQTELVSAAGEGKFRLDAIVLLESYKGNLAYYRDRLSKISAPDPGT